VQQKNQPDLSRLIAAGDRQAIAKLGAAAAERGEDTDIYSKALEEAVTTYLKSAPPID
jgi:hypothetical protein